MTTQHHNCTKCGSFTKKESIDDYEWEDEVVQWWVCPKCGLNHPEHLYFKSQIRNKDEK